MHLLRTKLAGAAASAIVGLAPAQALAGGARCEHPNVPARTLHAVEPAFPPDEAEGRAGATVEVTVTLDETSAIVGAVIRRSTNARLNEPVLNAVRASTFQTEVHDCKPLRKSYVFVFSDLSVPGKASSPSPKPTHAP